MAFVGSDDEDEDGYESLSVSVPGAHNLLRFTGEMIVSDNLFSSYQYSPGEMIVSDKIYHPPR